MYQLYFVRKESIHFKKGFRLSVHLECMFFVRSSVLLKNGGLVHYSQNPQVLSYNTIHTFKNYFITVFSVFSNKRYPNRP